MPEVGFEPTIPVFERANTVHALERAATVIVSGGTDSPFLISALNEGEWSASRPSHFSPGENPLDIHCVGD
jgi:hypothetical protein